MLLLLRELVAAVGNILIPRRCRKDGSSTCEPDSIASCTVMHCDCEVIQIIIRWKILWRESKKRRSGWTKMSSKTTTRKVDASSGMQKTRSSRRSYNLFSFFFSGNKSQMESHFPSHFTFSASLWPNTRTAISISRTLRKVLLRVLGGSHKRKDTLLSC